MASKPQMGDLYLDEGGVLRMILCEYCGVWRTAVPLSQVRDGQKIRCPKCAGSGHLLTGSS